MRTVKLNTAVFPFRTEPAQRPAGANAAYYCEQGALALPAAPAFRSQRDKGTGRLSSKKVHGYQQTCGGWEKRHSEGRRYNDGMEPMLSTRPASRQSSLSGLMDLNLSLKFDKTGKQGETRQSRKRSQEPLFARSSGRDDGGTAGEKSGAWTPTRLENLLAGGQQCVAGGVLLLSFFFCTNAFCSFSIPRQDKNNKSEAYSTLS